MGAGVNGQATGPSWSHKHSQVVGAIYHPVHLTACVWTVGGRKANCPEEETHTDTGRTCTLHIGKTPVTPAGNHTQNLLT